MSPRAMCRDGLHMRQNETTAAGSEYRKLTPSPQGPLLPYCSDLLLLLHQQLPPSMATVSTATSTCLVLRKGEGGSPSEQGLMGEVARRGPAPPLRFEERGNGLSFKKCLNKSSPALNTVCNKCFYVLWESGMCVCIENCQKTNKPLFECNYWHLRIGDIQQN